MPTLDDIMADASPVERVVSVCVAGKLVAEYQQLEFELERAQQADLSDRRLSGSGDSATAVAEKMLELEDRMRASTYTFRFKALTPKSWSDLMAKHGDKDGKKLFNPETFPPAAIAACCTEPEGMNDPAKVTQLMEVLSPSQQADLFDGAWEVNTQSPKGMTSYAASAVLRASEMSSNIARSEVSPAASSLDESSPKVSRSGRKKTESTP